MVVSKGCLNIPTLGLSSKGRCKTVQAISSNESGHSAVRVSSLRANGRGTLTTTTTTRDKKYDKERRLLRLPLYLSRDV